MNKYIKGDPMFLRNSLGFKQYEYLTEDILTDVVIIGGGVTGAIISYYFSEKNIPNVILEKSRIGHGSTSITTALLQYELDKNLNELINVTSIEEIILSYKLGVKALNEIKKIVDKYGNQCEYSCKDTLLYTSKKLEVEQIKKEYDSRLEKGFDVEYISEENNPFSFDLKAGVYGRNGGAQLDPFKFAHELIDISVNKCGKVFENSEATNINYLEDGVEVETIYKHKVQGKIVIIATGYDIEKFTDRNLGNKSITFNIVTKPVENFLGWKNNVLIRNNNEPYNYLRTTDDNRIIMGGEDISLPLSNIDKEKAMYQYNILESKLKNMFPKIPDIEIQYKYCGTFASTKDDRGFIGEDPNNKKLWYCLGYGANGILFSILGGIMLSNLYLGETNSNLKLFKIDRF